MSVFKIKSVTSSAPMNAPQKAIERWQGDRDFYSGNAKDGKSFLNYMKLGTPKEEILAQEKMQERVFGMFDENGILNSKSEKKIKNELKNTESHIWTGVINFEKEEGVKHCSSVEQAQIGFEKAFTEFCAEANLNKKNLTFVASLHENSELFHLHYMFYEKQPRRLSKVNDELNYSKKFVIDKNAVKKMPEILDRAFGGLLQENTLKTLKIKTLAKERAGEYNFIADLKGVAKLLKSEVEPTTLEQFGNRYQLLNPKTKGAVDKLIVKAIKRNGIKNYNDALKATPRQLRKEFRAKTYNDIGIGVIKYGLDICDIEEEKKARLRKYSKERKTYDLSRKEEINYRLIKKVAKLKTEQIEIEFKGLKINEILKDNCQVMINKNAETIAETMRRKL